MTGHVKVGGTWKSVASVNAKVAGAWKAVDSGFTRIAGVWKRFYSSAPPAAMELIATATGTGSSGTITFSSIPQTYKHVVVRFVARSNDSSGVILSGTLRFNGDSSASYARHLLEGTGSGVQSGSGVSLSQIDLLRMVPGGGNTSGSFGAGVIELLDYSSTLKNKTVRALYGSMNGPISSSDSRIILSSGLWINTAATTSITFTTIGSFVTGSRFSLYGIKG